jgi:hypothetical protein
VTEIDTLIEGYWRWLRDKTIVKQVADWAEITTPYLDRHNDYIQIYAQKNGKGFILTDDGYTIADLEHSGCNLESSKRQEILQSILNGFGVQNNKGAIEVHTSPDSFALKKHNLIQAIISVSDMFFLASPTVEAIFYEDVLKWLELSEIRFITGVKFSGRSGFDHRFDFVIPKSREASERIIRVINNANRTAALNFIQAWEDTQPSRPENSMPFAFLNDSERPISPAVIDALTNYKIQPVEWSRRDNYRMQLAA